MAGYKKLGIYKRHDRNQGGFPDMFTCAMLLNTLPGLPFVICAVYFNLNWTVRSI